MSAFALAFSALLRVGEFACTSSNESEKIIQYNDINFDNDNTLSLRLSIVGMTVILREIAFLSIEIKVTEKWPIKFGSDI
jgi:hypothetical protein